MSRIAEISHGSDYVLPKSSGAACLDGKNIDETDFLIAIRFQSKMTFEQHSDVPYLQFCSALKYSFLCASRNNSRSVVHRMQSKVII